MHEPYWATDRQIDLQPCFRDGQPLTTMHFVSEPSPGWWKADFVLAVARLRFNCCFQA